MRRTIALLALALAWAPSPASAQTTRELPPTPLIVRPATEPRPALKYRLVPERALLVPGNAAVFYHRAVQLTIERRARLDVQEKPKPNPDARRGTADEQVNRWVTGPIAEVPRDEARKVLDGYRNALKEVELGASRSSCDWEFDRRTEGIYLLLPEIQEMRSVARLVALRARLALLDGKTDEAMHWVETGMVMGRHVSQGPTIIQALVGVAIDSVMARCLEDLIQAPGTPSLYWALADRPRPFIDARQAWEGERYNLEREVPGLADLDRGIWSVDQARRFADELQRKLFAIASGEPIPGTDGALPTEMPAAVRRLGVAAMCAKTYPEARRALIAGGRPEAEVDAMPVTQVATLHAYQEYIRLRDEMYKWVNVPYWQSFDRFDLAGPRTPEEKMSHPLLTMFQILTPALNAARLAFLRLDRQLDALQCIEAVRLHAAAHGGRLPESLSAINEVPTPLDPATGKPFDYKSDGSTATLSAPVPPGAPNHPSFMIRYALKRAR